MGAHSVDRGGRIASLRGRDSRRGGRLPLIVNVTGVYNQSGKLVEKYDVITTGRSGGGGEYPLQDGFGWTNGVMRKLIALYPKDASYSTATQCPRG